MSENLSHKADIWIEKLSRQRHIVILRESLQPVLMFWVCIGITLLVAKYATSFPMKKLSAIAIMVMMASLVDDYAVWILLAIGLGECFGFLSKFELDNRFTPERARKYLADLFPCIGTMLLGLFIAFLSPLFFPLIRKIFLLITHLFDSLAFVWITVLIVSLSKLFKPELGKIYRAVMRPFWIYMSLANLYAFFHRSAYPFITTESFYHWFVWIGGAGAAIGLAMDLLLVRRKKCNLEYIREGIFNLSSELMKNEVMKDRKKYAIPFVAAPAALATVSYLAIANGYIVPSRLLSPWMLPGPIGAFIATGMDFRAISASLLCILASMIIYFPFVLKNEKH